jgi:hypothetical protein
MLGGGNRVSQNENFPQSTSKNTDEPSQIDQNDLDDEIPF